MDNNSEPIKTPKKIWFFIVLLVIGASIVSALIIAGGVYVGFRYLAKHSTSTQLPTPPAPVTFIDFPLPSDAPVLGNENAEVLILEFADFQCPYCQEFHNEILPRLKAEYIDTGKVRFAFLDFAFLGDESVRAASAARCAKDQGKFWEYHDLLYKNQNGENEGTFNPEKLKELGKELNLNTSDFNSCVDARLAEAEVVAATNSASEAGISSTPTLLVNGKVAEGVRSFEEYISMIEDKTVR